MRRFWVFRAMKFVIFLVLFLLVGGFITMELWNSLIPVLFHGPVLTFWQTIGLLVLCKILFGGPRFGRRPDRHNRFREKCDSWKEKMKGMSEEEKQHFKENFKKSFTVNIN
jgi:hypothetical protein